MVRKKVEESFDFEEGMQRLEDIIAKFDEGGLTLDEMESSFVEGAALVKKCSERIDNVETRITKLASDSGSRWSEEPFDEVDDE
jgi:exodeoxyribonuclease VII small subunit